MLNLIMNQVIYTFWFLTFMIFQVNAQFASPTKDNFQPSLAVVIGVLTATFSLSVLLLIYAKYCHGATGHIHNNNQTTLDDLIRSESRSSGIDKTVIDSLPFFRFSLLKGSREGLECAVCLSRFEDVDILRFLPKCKHAFHIDCVDQWLEKNSSCPLCRQKVSIDDLSLLNYSSSLRFPWNPSELRENLNIDIFVQREDSHKGSSRFSIGNSFRKFEKVKEEEDLPIQENFEDSAEKETVLHRFKHKIIVSDFIFKNRWSNMSSSDLMFLNSEMINSISIDRFSSSDQNKETLSMRTRGIEEEEIMNIQEERARKMVFESKIGNIKVFDVKPSKNDGSRRLNPSEKRSMSEITVRPRSIEFITTDSIRESHLLDATKEEKKKMLWYRLSQRTALWFANREKRPQPNTSQTFNV